MTQLKELAVGDEFTWCGVRFRLDSHEAEPDSSGRELFPVTYMTDVAGGEIVAGTTGLMPVDESVNEPEAVPF